MAESQVMIITGASKGIGRETARVLAAAGVRLSLCARNIAPLKELALAYPEQILCQAFELEDLDAGRRFVEASCSHWGRLDTLINNAGSLGPVANLALTDLPAYQAAMQTNFFAPLAMSGAAIPHLRRSHGRLINLNTGAAQQSLPCFSAYCTSKAALWMLTQNIAQEEPEITALSFVPGVVDTPMQQQIREQGCPVLPSPWREYFASLPQTGALATPELIGRLLAWCALHAPHSWSGKMLAADDPAFQKSVLSND